MNNKVINVKIHGKNVGRLAMTKNYCCAFEYDGDWLLNGFSISPFSLPLVKKVFVADREPFDGIFGVFNDSLPDGWGRLLIDRMLQKRGISENKAKEICGENKEILIKIKKKLKNYSTPLTSDCTIYYFMCVSKVKFRDVSNGLSS